MDLKAIIKWNNEQREHERLVQHLTREFCDQIMDTAIDHDASKWGEFEYAAFLDSHDSLRQAKDGFDPEYQKHLKGQAIQAHVHNNPHHAEHWDNLGEPMPVYEVISMFFDWLSRSKQKGTGLGDFWEYNLAKLTNQPHAVPIVEALRREYEELEAISGAAASQAEGRTSEDPPASRPADAPINGLPGGSTLDAPPIGGDAE